MSFFGSLGKKIGGAVSSMGKKARATIKKGVKFTADKAGKIADVAGSVKKVADGVGKVAGFVGSGAATLAAGAAMVGLEPVAAGLAGVAAAGKGVQGLATGVSSVAGKVEGAARDADTAAKTIKAGMAAKRHGEAAIDSMRKGNIMDAIKEGEKAVDAGEAAGKGASQFVKKEIQRRK